MIERKSAIEILLPVQALRTIHKNEFIIRITSIVFLLLFKLMSRPQIGHRDLELWRLLELSATRTNFTRNPLAVQRNRYDFNNWPSATARSRWANIVGDGRSRARCRARAVECLTCFTNESP
ncbi:hypothetical protein EVAR_75426_1 [Eumeta japonica]|uniref:Uncharacterized protein n=1 Tax=Eumeta variegata TaxID=151549 RepID=A0A4C1TMW6_EUMVA|nr:hypothetical protein EVAR_75426_1 [Eumeta japonica]